MFPTVAYCTKSTRSVCTPYSIGILRYGIRKYELLSIWGDRESRDASIDAMVPSERNDRACHQLFA